MVSLSFSAAMAFGKHYEAEEKTLGKLTEADINVKSRIIDRFGK